MQKIRTTVKIAGKEYNISGYDPEEYVQRVAAHGDRRRSERAREAKMKKAQMDIRTAGNATDDMMKSRDELRRLRHENDLLRAALEDASHDEKA